MNTFRTDVRTSPSPNKISHSNRILTVGSCFADAIGDRLVGFKFQSLVNPFGIIFNPISIHKVLHLAIHHEPPAEHTYLKNNDISLNYDFHSELSHLDRHILGVTIANRIGIAHYFLKDADTILITYGTAWVYSRKDTGEIVANCHKMPAEAFTKSLLTESEIVESFQLLHDALLKFNPGIKIILTLSPVRHIKDTLELNSVSKAILRVACHTIVSKLKRVEYFPAYEILMDDLRDYRFYKSDMLHPTEAAEEYVWEKFSEQYFNDDTLRFLKQWQLIHAALQHKPFHPASAAHQQFLKDTLKKLEELKSTVNVSEEISAIQTQLLK